MDTLKIDYLKLHFVSPLNITVTVTLRQPSEHHCNSYTSSAL
jgi:hypothetical protein